MKLGMQVDLGPGHIALDGDAAPPPISAHICCGYQMAAWIKMPLGMEVGFGPGDFALDGDPAPPPQKGDGAPKFLARVYCGQTAGWIKMVLGMEVGLSPSDFVFDGTTPPPQKGGGAPSPVFGPFLFLPNSLIHRDATWYIGRPHPTGLCGRWGPRPLPKKGSEPPKFSDHVYCGQTAGWMKTPLGTEVDLGPGHIVLDGFQLSTIGTQQPPSFRSMSIVATVAHLSYCRALVFFEFFSTFMFII